MDELLALVRQFSRRLRWRDGWLLAQRSMWIAAILALLIQLIGRLAPIEKLLIWTSVPLVAWSLLVLTLSRFRPLPALRVARRVDLELGLKQRISTALALSENASAAPERFPIDLLTAQRRDALKHARQAQPKRDLPITWLKRPTILAGVLLLGVLVLALLPNPMDDLIAQRHQVSQAAAEQAKKIDDLHQEIEGAQELSPETKDELLRQLAELAEALRANPGDPEQALADLARLEAALQSQLAPNLAARAANLSALASQLAALNGESPTSDAQAMEAALQALEELSDQLDKLSPSERQELSQTLAQMAAGASQAGDMQIAQALSALSQAVAAGDLEAASQAASDAQAAVAQAAQDLADQQALEAVLAQLNASGQAIAQAGSSMPGEGIAGSPAGSPGGAPGDSPGQASGQPTGGGTQADTLPPSQGQGTAGAPQGPAAAPASGSLPEQVYAPRQAGAGKGEPLFIPGAGTGQGEAQVSEGGSPLPGATNPAIVPYNQVYYEYLQAANHAMNQITVPASLEAYVQAYFSQLEP